MHRAPIAKESNMFSVTPDFTLLGDSVSKDPSFCSNPYSLSDPATFDSHLLPRVPSPSLPLEEMLGLWPSDQENISSSKDKECGVNHLRTRRDSVTTLLDFGDWVSGESWSRSSSLLPPAPLFYRGRPSHLDSDKVDCDLLWAPLQTQTRPEPKLQTAPNNGAPLENLSRPYSHLHQASLETSDGASSNTRPTTPVPSLSHSHHSLSSLSTIEQTYQASKPTKSCDVPGPVGLVDPSGASMHSSKADRSIANAFSRRSSDDMDYDPPNLLEAHPFSHQPEVSYIDWDDGDGARAQSRLARMKKNLADLRAAERYISEAYTNGRTPLLKHKNDTLSPKRAPMCPTFAEGTSDLSRQKQCEPRNDKHGEWKPLVPKEAAAAVLPKPKRIGNIDTPARLRKQPSARLLSKEATKPNSPITGHVKRDRRRTVSSELEAISPLSQVSVEPGLTKAFACPSAATPSSTCKRKRFSMAFVRPIRNEKKPASLSVVGKWLRRLLGLRRERED